MQFGSWPGYCQDTGVTPPHRFFTCTVCTTFRPDPRIGACVNTTTGRPAASSSLARKKASCSSSTCTSCTLQGLLRGGWRVRAGGASVRGLGRGPWGGANAS